MESPEEQPAQSRSRGHGRGRACRGSRKKTVCRSTNRKSHSPAGTAKHPQTLASARKERYGVGNKSTAPGLDLDKYGRGKRKRGPDINYSKLNEGLDQDEQEPLSPKRFKHTPVRSGPSQER